MKRSITFPHLGDYYIPIRLIICDMLKCKCLIPPPITRKTLDIGAKYSPNNVCAPFKYNLGNFIEGLEMGADTIIQAGGGCRYGYYAEVQERILKDLGYNIDFVNLFDKKKGDKNSSILYVYKKLKGVNDKLSFIRFSYYGLLAVLITLYMDRVNRYINKNRCYEVVKGSFKKMRDDMYQELLSCNRYLKLLFIKLKYFFKLRFVNKSVPNKNKRYKILVTGELYTLMEYHANLNIEEEFSLLGFEVYRNIDLTNLVIFNKIKPEKLFKKKNKYLKYHLGATGTYTVYNVLNALKKGYDGVAHIKSFGCTPEINAMPILQRISGDLELPIIFLSFDTENSDEAMKTRVEAFSDMIKMRRYGR